ncbi:hypothetical protein, partial [Elizabethkingia meningoseptica]
LNTNKQLKRYKTMKKNDNYLPEHTGKKDYKPPVVMISYVTMEQGIAASSAQIIPGGSSNTPAVTDWDEKKDEQNWEF